MGVRELRRLAALIRPGEPVELFLEDSEYGVFRHTLSAEQAATLGAMLMASHEHHTETPER